MSKDAPAMNAIFVQQLLPAAIERLVKINYGAPLIDVARLLRVDTDLVVVCDAVGVVVGVITKTDVVDQISRCDGSRCETAASLVMTRDITLCRPSDELHKVWSKMKERGVKNVPVIDEKIRPLGVLNARDALQLLLQDAEYEDSILRDYVMGVGYR